MGSGGKDSEPHPLIDDQQKKSPPITTSNQIVNNDSRDRQYTWDEIRCHSYKTDRWIVINKRVYDITRWTKHPGGQNVFNNYAGQDATEAFQALHSNTVLVQKYLKTFYIGDLVEDKGENNSCLLDDQALQQDFEQLRQKAIAKNLFQSSGFFFFITCFHILALEFAAYFILFRFGISWLPYLSTIILYSIAQAQAGWIQHDFGHLSVFQNTSWNHILHHIFLGFTKGASPDWWNNMHFQHHSKPNVIDKDPDTRIETLFLVGDTIPIRKAQTNAKYGKTLPYNFQHIYFVLIAPLVFPVYFQFMTFRHAVKRQKWMDIAWLSLFYIKFFSLMSMKLGIVGAFYTCFIIRAIEGSWFVVVSQSNHIVMDISHDDSKMSWFRMQLKATCNIEKSQFNDWFTGHLNFQIEHHLFPMMPRHNLYKIQPEVMDLCRKYNIPYIVKPIGQAFYDIFTSLEKSGRMWLETYEELMESAHTDSN